MVEFKIGDSAPKLIRKGITQKEFDGSRNHKTITGPPGGLAHEIAALKVGDQSFATVLGLFQKCIGVRWSQDARFVMGWGQSNEAENSMKYLDVTGKDKTKLELLKAIDADTDVINFFQQKGGQFPTAGSFLTCMCGGIVNETTPSFIATTISDSVSSGGIFHSPDGIKWSLAYEVPELGGDTFSGSTVWICTFDGTQFLAAAQLFTNSQNPQDINFYDILLSSADGKSWGMAGLRVVNIIDPGDGLSDKSTLIAPHLDQRFKNTDGLGAPSGQFGEKKSTDGSSVIIRPAGNWTVEWAGVGYAPPQGSKSVLITGAGKGKKSKVDLGFDVGSVAYGGKVTDMWLATGPAFLSRVGTDLHAAISVDDGQTWTEIVPPTMPVNPDFIPRPGIVGSAGAPLQFFNLITQRPFA